MIDGISRRAGETDWSNFSFGHDSEVPEQFRDADPWQGQRHEKALEMFGKEKQVEELKKVTTPCAVSPHSLALSLSLPLSFSPPSPANPTTLCFLYVARHRNLPVSGNFD